MKEENQLEEMKKKYETIEVPKELKEKVEQSILKAKRANERNDFMRKISKRFGYGTVAALLAITILANSGEEIAYAMGRIPVLGEISKIVTFREYEHQDGTMQAHIKTPKVEGENDSIKNLNKQMEAYTDEIKKSYEADLNTILKEFGDTKNAYEDLKTDYHVILDNEEVLSIQIQTSIVMAGTNSFSKFYTLDKRTGKILQLKDLFKENVDYQKVISENIIEQMKQQMKEDKSKSYFYYEDHPEDPLNFKEIDKNQDFYFDKNGQLNLAFDKYEIAPGYMGECYFTIPYNVIKDIVKENTVLTDMQEK